MGLLSNTGHAIADEALGLLNFFRRPEQPQGYNSPSPGFQPPVDAPASTPGAVRPPTRGQVGYLLQDIGSGLQGGPGGRVDAYRAHQAAQAQQARLLDLAQQAGLSPEEMLAMQLDPKSLGGALASHSNDVVLNSGAVRNRGGVNIAGAPVIAGSADRVRSTDPITGETTYSDPRPPSYAEQTTRASQEQSAKNAQQMQAYREFQIQLQRQRQAELARHNRSTEGTAAARERRIGAGGGGGGKATVPALPPGFVLEK